MEKIFKLLDVVALSADLPKEGLLKGQVGTIVEILSDSVFEVEFSNNEGKTYSLLPLKSSQLIQLHFNPAKLSRAYAS
ncbi:MAG: DUF4926 domain-containing protein [Ignavibacteria bacterium]|nr:DUF4926 domain-containing protein [Ignavibacteria bacterium]